LRSLYRRLQKVLIELDESKFPSIPKQREVSAREVLKDIKAGNSPDFLKEKYRLSSSGLKDLFCQLEEAGLLTNHSGKQLRISEIAADVRTGMLEPDIMERHDLTFAELQWVVNCLTISKFLEPEEIAFLEFACPQRYDNPLPTRYPTERIEISENDNSGLAGEVQFFRGNQIFVEGMSTRKGEIKSVLLRRESLQHVASSFRVKCEWDISGTLAKFTITHITPASLRDLIQWVTAQTICEKTKATAKDSANGVQAGLHDIKLMNGCKPSPNGHSKILQEMLRSELLSRFALVEQRNEQEKPGDSPEVSIDVPSQSECQDSESPKSRYSYSGRLEGIDILDYIQWMLLDGKQIVLEVKQPTLTTRIFVDRGKILHVSSPEGEGEEAFYSCVLRLDGEFLHLPWSHPEKITVEKGGMQLLFEAARRRDEANN
jgi:hypothetical protein